MDWQYADGAVRLLRELSSLWPEKVESSLMTNFTTLVDSLNFQDTSSSISMLEETVWEIIPQIAKSLGKRPFKRHLDPLIPAMVRAISGDRLKSAHAAASTCQFLRAWVGEGIFRSRVESISPLHFLLIEACPPKHFEAPLVSFKA